MQKNQILLLIISIALIIGILYVLSDTSKPSMVTSEATESQNVEIRDGVQYVTITARVGYSPRTSIVKSDIPTKLIVKTNSTYDCSSSLVIREVGFQKILKPTGEEIIDLGTLKQGKKISGTCGMGMYNFEIQSL